jgi:hypothetical protein
VLDSSKKNSILEKWSKKYKRSIDCSNAKGFSQKAHCAGRIKRKRGGKTKSRPLESFIQEITVIDVKKFIVNEIASNLEKELGKKKIKESAKILYEAVTVSKKVKKSKDPKKMKMVESVIRLAEKKLIEDYNEYDGGCDCDRGEGTMIKAQLLSIMVNAKNLFHMIDDEDQFEDWVQSKITMAEDYLRAAYGYMAYYNGKGEDEFGDDEFGVDGEDYDEVGEDNYDYDEDEESFEDDGMVMGSSNYDIALDAEVDDDEIFESKKSKKK